MSEFISLTMQEIKRFEQILEKAKKVADICARAVMCRVIDPQEYVSIGLLLDEMDGLATDSDVLLIMGGQDPSKFEGGE